MRTFRTAVQTLFPVVTEIEAEPRPAVPARTPRGSGLLGQVIPLACALAPLGAMIEAYRQTV